MASSGRFITFEGGEGSGKSTQARLLADKLQAEGINVALTREPGGSPFAEQVRALILDPTTHRHSALSEALLFYAARADLLDKVIRPALIAGHWVVCDRFSDSTRVYQVDAGGLALDVFKALELIVVKLTYPDLTFVLDLPAEVGLSRATTRRLAQALAGGESDGFEQRDIAFHERLREGYRAIAAAEPRRCVLLDGANALEAIAAEVWTQVERRLLASSR
jgi:dTMP kinase